MNLFSQYDKFNSAAPASGALATLRQAGFDYVSHKGLPTRKDEDWHYTSVRSIAETEYLLGSLADVKAVSNKESFANYLNPEFTNLVFVNGKLNENLSDALPANVSFGESQVFADTFLDAFDALNGAYAQQVYELQIKAEENVAKPLHLVFVSVATGGAIMNHPRLKVVVGARANASVLESYYGFGGRYLVNSFCEIEVKESAKLIYARVQCDDLAADNIGRTQVSLQKFAQFESLAFAAGALLSRHSLDVQLKGAGADAQVLGVYATKGQQHVDNTTLIDHQIGECNTNQLYKGILDETSKAVFCGKVLIRKDAQKANSAQLNNNLLLDSRAEADSKPCLEIYADDVKAAHGSTVGQLDADEIFYMQSRAIQKDQAILMLSYGFLTEVIFKLSDVKVQKWLSKHLQTAFEGLHING